MTWYAVALSLLIIVGIEAIIISDMEREIEALKRENRRIQYDYLSKGRRKY